MNNFISDFRVFYSGIIGCINSFWSWFMSSIIGEIFIFIILLSLFLFIINLFINFKD